MIEPISQLESFLRKHQKSVTQTRLLVFEALLNQEPQSMHDLVRACQHKIDRASIYRIIALYEKLGIVQRLQIGWKYKLELSNDFNYHHHHLTCQQCGTIIPLPEDTPLETRLMQLASDLNFFATDHQIEIKGVCLACQKLAVT